MYKQMKVFVGTLFLCLSVGNVYAGASQADIDRLGKDLTPLGAEKAGNSAGTIPEWNGGLTKRPPVTRRVVSW